MALRPLQLPLPASQTRRMPTLSSFRNPTGTRILRSSPPVRSITTTTCVATPATTTTTTTDPNQQQQSVIRRSGNYPPTCWDDSFIQSHQSDFTEEKYGKQASQLKDSVRNLIRSDMAPIAKLELIDCVQRLGLKYQFETEIKEELDHLYLHESDKLFQYNDYHANSLAFRLFRQHEFQVSTEIFRKFKDETGSFRAPLSGDLKGMLNLYEASFLDYEDETIIDEARVFATTMLKEMMKGDISASCAKKIEHALTMPFHRSLQRVETRWYIDICYEEKSINPILLEFAKLDYNMVQAVHQKEIRTLSKWWLDLDMAKISFARDRLLEHYLWCCGMLCEPQYSEFREVSTKLLCFTSTIDDVYDVYGTIEELELVTDFIDRWDINEIDKLPRDIQICLLALYNTTNNVGYWFLKERGFNILPYLRKMWSILCNAYMKEARWFYGEPKPTYDEYLENGVISIAGPLMLFSAYFMTTEEKLTKEGCNYVLEEMPPLMYQCCTIFRLTDDEGTSSIEIARGDNWKAVQCYMHEHDVSEEVARGYIKGEIDKYWKAMNKELLNHAFKEPFSSAHPNLCQTSHCFYQCGDGHGFPEHATKDFLMDLLFKPIPL